MCKAYIQLNNLDGSPGWTFYAPFQYRFKELPQIDSSDNTEISGFLDFMRDEKFPGIEEQIKLVEMDYQEFVKNNQQPE